MSRQVLIASLILMTQRIAEIRYAGKIERTSKILRRSCRIFMSTYRKEEDIQKLYKVSTYLGFFLVYIISIIGSYVSFQKYTSNSETELKITGLKTRQFKSDSFLY